MSEPLLQVLSFSGGKQSSALLWMVLLGKLDIDKDKFVVLNADPGMERSETYKYVRKLKIECEKSGIYFKTVEGGDLYDDIINLKNTNKTRFDNPPYWTMNEDGSKGRLRQSCTQHYKIKPMDKEIRRLLWERYGIPINRKRLGNNIVEKWIGFTLSEVERVKPSRTKYAYFRYPLIEMRMTNKDVIQFYNDNGLPIPMRSVCNACFANGLETFRDMFNNHKDDWEQAVNVDNSIRDLTQVKIKSPCFVSNTLISLEELADNEFDLSNFEKNLDEDYSCDSGYCFL